MRITLDDEAVRRDFEHLKKRIVPAAKEASEAATQEFAKRLLRRVQDMIPNKGGWYDIYRRSIKLIKTDEGWELTTTIKELAPEEIPAESSVAYITPADSKDKVAVSVAALLSQAKHNPWTMDTIPALYGGLPANLRIEPASVSEVEHFRKLRLAELPSLFHSIRSLGGNIFKFDAPLPVIKGRVVADVPFLALRLEYGYGGFPQTPIWARIDQEGQIISQSVQVKKAGYGTFADRWREKK